MPAIVSQGRGGRYQTECRECDIGPFEPRSLYGAQRSPDKRDGARGYLESLCRLHNAKYHAPCEG